MKLLHFIFEKINPSNKVTWLSVQYHKWEYERRDRRISNFRKNINFPINYYNIAGAGDICVSQNCDHVTGKVVGFSFGVEWSNHPFHGGVLGRDEAEKLAKFILLKCAEKTESMDDEYKRVMGAFK
jgi:hypothetical protein